MATAGQFVVDDDGKFAVDDDGKFRVFNANGECPECCGGEEPEYCNTCLCSASVVISGMTGNAAGFNGCHNLDCISDSHCGNHGIWTCDEGCDYQAQFYIMNYPAQIDLYIPSVCESDQPVTAYFECWMPSLMLYCGSATFEYDCRNGGFDGTAFTLTPDPNCGTAPATVTLYESLCP